LIQNLQNNKKNMHEDLATQKALQAPPPLVGVKEWSQNKQNAYLNIKYKLQSMH
jgi:hypothetical protein